MRKRLAQVYLVLFTVLAIGGLIYGVHDHPLMEGLTRDEVRGAFKTNNPLKAGFINIGMPLADRSVAYRSKTFPKARRRAGSTPQLYDRCFFTQQQLDEMDDQTAEAVINEAIDFFEMSPSAMLTLKEVMELSPESEIRKKLDFPLGQEDLKASFVNCYLNRLLPFGQFAEIAAPTLLKLLTQRSDAANVAEVISRMEGIHFEPSEVEQLLTLMSSKDWNLQQAATKFLSRGTEEVIPFLIAAVTTPGESADNRRKFALTALFEAADRYPNVDLAQVIKEILLDEKSGLQREMLLLLEKYPSKATTALPILVELMTTNASLSYAAFKPILSTACEDSAQYAEVLLHHVTPSTEELCEDVKFASSCGQRDTCSSPVYIHRRDEVAALHQPASEFIKLAAKCREQYLPILEKSISLENPAETGIILEALLESGQPPRDTAVYTPLLESKDRWIFVTAIVALSSAANVDLEKSIAFLERDSEMRACFKNPGFTYQVARILNRGPEILLNEIENSTGEIPYAICTALSSIKNPPSRLMPRVVSLIKGRGMSCAGIDLTSLVFRANKKDPEILSALKSLWPQRGEFVCNRGRLETTLIRSYAAIASENSSALELLLGSVADLPYVSRKSVVTAITSRSWSEISEDQRNFLAQRLTPLVEENAKCIGLVGNVELKIQESKLHDLAYRGGVEDLKLALERDAAQLNSRGLECRTPLLTALRAKKTENVKFLIEKGADLNLPDSQGNTALALAIYSKDLPLVKFMLEKGAKTDVSNLYDLTPLNAAIGMSEPEIALSLIQAGADPNFNLDYRKTTSPLIEAIQKHKSSSQWNSVITELAKRSTNLSYQDKDGSTALHWVANDLESERYDDLIKAGANAEINNCAGVTPLRARENAKLARQREIELNDRMMKSR